MLMYCAFGGRLCVDLDVLVEPRIAGSWMLSEDKTSFVGKKASFSCPVFLSANNFVMDPIFKRSDSEVKLLFGNFFFSNGLNPELCTQLADLDWVPTCASMAYEDRKGHGSRHLAVLGGCRLWVLDLARGFFTGGRT